MRSDGLQGMPYTWLGSWGALHLVKLLPTVLLNSSVEDAAQMLEQHRFNPGPKLVALLRRVASAKPAFLRACTEANFFALTLGHMRATAFTSCLKALKQRSCVLWFGSYYAGSSLSRWFLSMMVAYGLLISPEPSTVDLEACLIEASLGLHPSRTFKLRLRRSDMTSTHHLDPSLGELCTDW